MKKIGFLLFVFSLISGVVNSQNTEANKLPATDVKTVDGKTFNTSKINNNGKPIVISFWATWCKPCKRELDAIAEEYEEWQKETGVKLVAISIDDSRSSGKVATDTKSHSWEYEVYLDENQDFKRAMNVNNIPHTFLLDGNGKIVWQHNSYAEGDEHHLYDIIRKLSKGEKID
jgi:cytochrome c biogenesis protein CcmG, thiol:disulfide interchange protein DsbE